MAFTSTSSTASLKMIFYGCILLTFSIIDVNRCTAMARSASEADKSVALLQQHLCRDECSKKVCRTTVTYINWIVLESIYNLLPLSIYIYIYSMSFFIVCILANAMEFRRNRFCNFLDQLFSSFTGQFESHENRTCSFLFFVCVRATRIDEN